MPSAATKPSNSSGKRLRAILLVDGSRPALAERAADLRTIIERNVEVAAAVDDLSKPLPAIEADLLIVAIGRTGMIRREHIKPGATVIDVGMNKVTDAEEVGDLFGPDADRRLQILSKRGYTLVGDVHPAEAAEVAGKLTPVPGGVGLLTVAMLMKSTLVAARRRGVNGLWS